MIVSGPILTIDKANIDTDQVIPAKHLTGISVAGLGRFLFEGMSGGRELLEAHPGARILVTRENFGCGSSREHAVWALKDWGLQAAIAPSFARIFLENCYNNAFVPVIVPPDAVDACFAAATIEIDVEHETLTLDGAREIGFTLDPMRKRFILEGGFLEYLNTKVPDVRAWLAKREAAAAR